MDNELFAEPPSEAIDSGAVHSPHSIRLAIVVAIVFLGLLAAAGWFGWRKLFVENPRYAIKTLRIETGIAKDETEIRTITGLREGMNLFAFRSSDVREALLRSTLNVAEVEIRKKLPDTVTIKVTDRLPLVKLSSEHLAADADGLVFTILAKDAARYRSIPFLENGAERLVYTPGCKLVPTDGVPETLDERVARAIRVLRIFADRPAPCFTIASADVSGGVYLEVRTRSKRLIRLAWEDLGDDDKVSRAYDLLAAVFSDRKNSAFGRFTVVLSRNSVAAGP